MGDTTRYDWPYPEQADVVDVPRDMTALANAIEETVGQIDDNLTTLTGSTSSTFQYTVVTRQSLTPMTIPEGEWTPVIFDIPQWNVPSTAPGWVAASPTRLTCNQPGIYTFNGSAGFKSNTNGSRAIAFRVNGNASYPAINSGTQLYNDIPWYGTVTCEARLNATDWVELVVRQAQTNTSLQMDTAVIPRFSIRRMA